MSETTEISAPKARPPRIPVDSPWAIGQTVVLMNPNGTETLEVIERMTPAGFAAIGDRMFRHDGYERVDGVAVRDRSRVRDATNDDLRRLGPKKSLFVRLFGIFRR